MAALIEPHIPALRRFAWALLRSGQGADDLVQDCLERAVGAWASRHRDADVRPWLFAILNNCFLNDRRRDKRRGPHVTIDGLAEEPGGEPRQEAGLHYADVVRALAALPEDQRAVLLLVGVEDMAYAEAAGVLGIPIGTVMSRLSRGRAQLRRYVAGDEAPGRSTPLRSVK